MSLKNFNFALQRPIQSVVETYDLRSEVLRFMYDSLKYQFQSLDVAVNNIKEAEAEVAYIFSVWNGSNRPSWCTIDYTNDGVRKFLQHLDVARGILGSVDKTCSALIETLGVDEQHLRKMAYYEDLAKCYVRQYVRSQENVEALYDAWCRKDKEV